MKRWSATILIETDDDDAALAAGIAARAGAQQAVAGVGHVAVSELMSERDA